MNFIRYHPSFVLLFLFLLGLTLLQFLGHDYKNGALKPINNDSPASSLNKSSHPLLLSDALESLDHKLDETPLQPSCRRVCNNQYQNVILLTRLGRAGWSDRVYTYLSILQLAGYLCAQVWVPRPKHVLTPRHNKGQELSINVSWSDLGDFQFVHHPVMDNAPSNGRYTFPLTKSPYISPLVEWKNDQEINPLPDPKDVLDDPSYMGWLYANTSKIADFISDFERVEELSWNNNDTNNNSHVGFIWEIRANYFQWKNIFAKCMLDRRMSTARIPSLLSTDEPKLRANFIHNNNHSQWQMIQPFIISKLQFDPNLSEGCTYSTLQAPTHVQAIINKIRTYAMNPGSHTSAHASTFSNSTQGMSSPGTDVGNATSFLMGYFHIRRNDAIKDCDTSLDSIDRYLNCSFDTLGPLLSTSGEYDQRKSLVIVIFLSSDESDPDYRQAVVQMIEKQTDRLRYATDVQVSVNCIDTDKLVNQLLDEEIQQGNAPEWRRNNFYVYQTIYFLSQNRTMVQFKLEKRRTVSCPHCTNITEQILEI